ncbi:MAG TPA: ATP-binding protein [Vicinamibacteria bacterium]|nr:ATP-binding protein [Vicinamibacteria bacterium]
MRRKLFWKLGLTFLSLLLLAFSILYFYTGRVVEEHLLGSSIEKLESFVRLAETRPPDMEDPRALAEWTEWLSLGGARVTVIARDGTVLSDSDEDFHKMENHAGRPEIVEAFRSGRGTSNRYSNTVRRDLVYLAVRYEWGRDPPVVLRIAESVYRIEDAIAEVRRPVGMVSVALLVVVGLASLVFSRLLSARVARLQELSKRVAEGDFTPAPLDGVGDELTELAASMNETAMRLETSIRSMREERNQSATILSSMSEGVAVVGPDERILYLNRAFRRSLGLPIDSWEAYRGVAIAEAIKETELTELVRRAIEQHERAEASITVGGTIPPRQLLARAAPVSEGPPIRKTGAVLVLLDVTEIHRLERVRRDFVANVSHELKTPLTAIQGFAETLLAGAMEDPQHSRKFLEIVRDHAIRIGRLTDDLLKLSHIESGKMEPRIESLDMARLVESLVETSRLKAQPKGIEVHVDLPGAMPPVNADSDWLSEVLQNLLDNAIQYTPPGGTIRVTASTSDDSIRISIADNGIGIPPESRHRIFERFYRVDTARSRAVGGTGLGLSIAKHLIESLGGRIELESELGAGSTFTIVLPKQPHLVPAAG